MGGKDTRIDFERWVDDPHMLSKDTEPGYADQYTHPWTAGAWMAWKSCRLGSGNIVDSVESEAMMYLETIDDSERHSFFATDREISKEIIDDFVAFIKRKHG